MAWADIPAANIARCRELLSLEGSRGPLYKCVRKQADNIKRTFQANDKQGRSDAAIQSSVADKADKTDLATEKLRKTIAERELLELKALRNRRELLRLFRSKAIAPAMKTVFAPLTEFLRKKLAKTDVKQWNDLVERMDAEFESALEGAIDGWDD